MYVLRHSTLKLYRWNQDSFWWEKINDLKKADRITLLNKGVDETDPSLVWYVMASDTPWMSTGSRTLPVASTLVIRMIEFHVMSFSV